jgi:hypothetical protein
MAWLLTGLIELAMNMLQCRKVIGEFSSVTHKRKLCATKDKSSSGLRKGDTGE